jgi:tRNA (guanine37-N1)-methyltransferase
LRIAVATLFPQLFDAFLEVGVVGRALADGLAEIALHDMRRHAVDHRGSVDDYQFGGGAGMVLRPETLFGTLEDIPWRSGARVVLMTPSGRRLDHALARELAEEDRMIIFCGRYGGVDERFCAEAVTDRVSVCEAVASGGEVPAMLLMETVLRWVPGVLGRMESARSDSYATGLLDHPRYTRPAEFRGMRVPDVLLSGDHAAIAAWRFERALERTRRYRPDLLEDTDPEELRDAFIGAMRDAERGGER